MTVSNVESPVRDSTTTPGFIARTSVGLPPPEEGQAPAVPVWVGGVLGERRVVQRDDGTFLNIPNDEDDALSQEERVLRACIPVAFYQEIMHRKREGKRDEMILEQPKSETNHPGVRLDPNTLLFKHNGMSLTHHAYTQLAQHARVPIEYFHRLVAQGVPQLAAMNVNMGIKLRAEFIRGAQNGSFIIRMLNDGVRAVLTDSYGIFDNHDMLDTFVECFPSEMVPELVVSQFWTDGHDVEGTVLIPSGWTNEPGHVFGVGIAFRNSEIGKRSMNFRPFVSRNGRLGMIYDKRETTNGVLEVKHTNGMTVESVKEQIRANVPSLLRSAQSLRTHLVNSRQIIIPNPREVLAALAMRYGIPSSTSRLWYRNWLSNTLSDRFTDEYVAATTPIHNTVFDLIDALMETALSQTSETMLSMQVMAGQMLIDGIDKTEAALTNHWMSLMIPAGQRLSRRSDGRERIYEYTVSATPLGAAGTTVEAPRIRRRRS